MGQIRLESYYHTEIYNSIIQDFTVARLRRRIIDQIISRNLNMDLTSG